MTSVASIIPRVPSLVLFEVKAQVDALSTHSPAAHQPSFHHQTTTTFPFEKMLGAFAAPYCGLSQLNSKGPSAEREHNVSRRPAVIGGLPLYLLRAVSHELRAVRAKASAHVEARSVSEELRRAADAAAAELDEQEAEINHLRARCAAVATALEQSDARVRAAKSNTAERVLAETARRFASGMTAASCRASCAERELEVLRREISMLQSELLDKEGDIVKANAAAFALTVALLTLWVRDVLLSV